jgi:hypothetical protein
VAKRQAGYSLTRLRPLNCPAGDHADLSWAIPADRNSSSGGCRSKKAGGEEQP